MLHASADTAAITDTFHGQLCGYMLLVAAVLTLLTQVQLIKLAACHACCCIFPAGITATLVCFPLDVLRTRLMAPWGHKYGGPLRTLQGMARFEGLGALYAGVGRCVTWLTDFSVLLTVLLLWWWHGAL